jgi:hypothetical protein
MNRRPQESEAAKHYFTYINKVPGNDIVTMLEKQLPAALEMLSGISEQTSLTRYAENKWSMRQTLNHINDTERIFSYRALWYARSLPSPLPGYDQNMAARASEADGLPWAAHVEEFRRVRLATVSLFAGLPEPAWDRTGTADGNLFTVRAIAYVIAGHMAHHLDLLRERYLHA